jgi:hypothetical protein
MSKVKRWQDWPWVYLDDEIATDPGRRRAGICELPDGWYVLALLARAESTRLHQERVLGPYALQSAALKMARYWIDQPEDAAGDLEWWHAESKAGRLESYPECPDCGQPVAWRVTCYLTGRVHAAEQRRQLFMPHADAGYATAE